MSRKKLPATREAQSIRNKGQRDERRAARNAPSAMDVHRHQQKLKRRRQFEQEAVSAWHAILCDVADELVGDNVEYKSMAPTDPAKAGELRDEVSKLLSEIDPKSKNEDDLIKAGKLLKTIHQRFLDSGLMKPCPPHIAQVPTVRVFGDGVIEAVDLYADEDAVAIRDEAIQFRASKTTKPRN